MKNKTIKILHFFMILMLIAAIALTATACMKSASPNDSSSDFSNSTLSFTLKVVYGDGSEDNFNIATEEKTVGAALLKEGIIAGEESQYGLFIKSVNNIVADYDVTGSYWAFYINGEYAMTGIDSTPIESGKTYELRIEKNA